MIHHPQLTYAHLCINELQNSQVRFGVQFLRFLRLWYEGKANKCVEKREAVLLARVGSYQAQPHAHPRLTIACVCVCVCAHLPLDEGEVLSILACTEVQWDRDGQEPEEKERNGLNKSRSEHERTIIAYSDERALINGRRSK